MNKENSMKYNIYKRIEINNNESESESENESE